MAEPSTIKEIAERNIRTLALRPERGLLTSATTARLVDGLRCEIEEGPWRLRTDMPTKVGGDGTAPTPGVLGRGALASCLVIGVAIWAARRGIEVRAAEVEVEADFDARGELGTASGVPAGYSEIRYRISIDSPASPDEIGELLAQVELHSPYLDVFGRALPLRRAVRVNGREA